MTPPAVGDNHVVIDLDDVLRPWRGGPSPAGWDGPAALALAHRLNVDGALTVEWEPGDEEWIYLGTGMISVRFPIALAVDSLAARIRDADPSIGVVEISGLHVEELRASADLLRATVLPYPWDEQLFNTEAFSAWDLFVESV